MGSWGFNGNIFIKGNIPTVWESVALGKYCNNYILIVQVCIWIILQGYCHLQLSSTMNLPCKFELSLISLLPSVSELFRFPFSLNMLVGPDPPFRKLIIQVNVGCFPRSYDVMLVLQIVNEKINFLVAEKRTQRFLKSLKHYKSSNNCATLFRKIVHVSLISSPVSCHPISSQQACLISHNYL